MSIFCDGSFYKNHPLFRQYPDALQVLLYYDDVELCNPLGSKIKKHKLALFYFVICNIKPLYRSRLEAINLLAAVPVSHITKYGFDIILQEFLKEMSILAEGIEIENECGKSIIRGAMLAFVADTLAAHMLGGFKEGVGFSLRKCRHCMIEFDNMQTLFSAQLVAPRTKDGHSQMCTKINGAMNNELREHYSTTYGINRESILCSIPFFDVIDCIPQDIMHVILEGCLPYTILQVLRQCCPNLFTVTELNKRITHFAFGYVDQKDKPSPIPLTALQPEGVLRQSSSQMWNLGRFLPLIIGDLIDFNESYWQCFLLLLQIMNICFCPIIKHESVPYLANLIKYYLELFKTTFNVNIIPKQHYLCHIPEQIFTLRTTGEILVHAVRGQAFIFQIIVLQSKF